MTLDAYLADPSSRFATVAMTDTNGLLRGQMVSVKSLAGIAKSGMGMSPVTFALDPTDVVLNIPGISDEASDFHDDPLLVDASTARRLPWSKPGYDLLVLTNYGGATSELCPRSMLSRVLGRAADAGFVPKYGMELEYTLFDETPESARAKGYRNLKSFRFLGIPYSNSPGRWEYAKVNPARGKTFDANTFGAPCIITGDPLSAEDCLFLNIRTPYLPSSEQATTPKLRPVVVFIHGGAFTSGTGGDPLGEGGNLASRGDVVMVTFNYRLSNLGFLVIPGTDVNGNYGFADQTVALHWVRDNIKSES
ncbi:MAG: hypothetical protein EOO77_45635, partial [Oxalobacteraceae bacterium]